MGDLSVLKLKNGNLPVNHDDGDLTINEMPVFSNPDSLGTLLSKQVNSSIQRSKSTYAITSKYDKVEHSKDKFINSYKYLQKNMTIANI